MLMLLLGTRSHSLLLTAALLLGSLLATMHARGLRVVMRVDGFGRLGMVLIRHGERVEGLAVRRPPTARAICTGSSLSL